MEEEKIEDIVNKLTENINNSLKIYDYFNSVTYRKKFQDKNKELKKVLFKIEKSKNSVKLLSKEKMKILHSYNYINISFGRIIDSLDYFYRIFIQIPEKKKEISNSEVNDLFSFFSEEVNKIINIYNEIGIVFNLFKEFNYFNHNTVLIGANGSGKTNLIIMLNKLLEIKENQFSDFSKNIKQNDIVNISAQKLLFVPIINSIPTKLKLEEKEDNLEDTKKPYILKKDREYSMQIDYVNNITNRLPELLNYLIYEDNNAKYNKNARQSLFDKIAKIWNNLLQKEIFISPDDRNIYIKNKHNTYLAHLCSDGEKAILLYIIEIIIAKKESIIFIDEPESFLHNSLLDKLWNKLESERRDLTFVYVTHNIQFAQSRIANKFWIKSYSKDKNQIENWDIEEIPILKDLPESLLLEILGSIKDILFVESENDAKIYELLLEDKFTIRGLNGCGNVINYTKAYNKIPNKCNKAFGLIDQDFHTEENIKNLSKNNIYTIKLSEIENLFLDEKFLEIFKDYKRCSKSNVNDIKNKIYKQFLKDKGKVALNKTKSWLEFESQKFRLNNPKKIGDLKEGFKVLKSLDIEKQYTLELNKLENLEYSNIIRVYNNKGLSKFANEVFKIRNFNSDAVELLKNKSYKKRKEAIQFLLKYIPKELKTNNGKNKGKLKVTNTVDSSL
ncbi:MAG: ATP-binding protein [Bifidobacteriaceae bacterium]|jgi:ABC-type cobalamin/Fe3+-siderophores transport system ATPase subunit|nr:ATP-binding protein [Bifidobacteriaceae bacterium]